MTATSTQPPPPQAPASGRSRSRSLRLGGREYPVVLPNVRDPRLHLAAVIISVHTLGQVSLGFRVSVPQIVIAIATCALIEVTLRFVSERQIVWPASAMLTGSGVALILRVVGMGRDDHWSFDHWWLFALIAAGSLATKYLVRWRGTHLFNPSNAGLVMAFLLLGSNTIEPLDFWWGPFGRMAIPYLIIVVGGLAITRRLGLLPMAATFWLVFASLIGVLSASGHCMTTAWALQPVCGSDFWWAVALSPEVLIFLFFMITDPKTIPSGHHARIVFAAAVATLATLLIATQSQEFGAKVGLLSGLVLLTPFSSVFDRLLGAPSTAPSASAPSASSVSSSPLPSSAQSAAPPMPSAAVTEPGNRSPRYLFGAGAVLGSVLVLMVTGIVAFGSPDGGGQATAQAVGADLSEIDVDVDVEVAELPPVVVSDDAAALDSGVAADPGPLADALVEALAIEGVAMLRQDTSLLRSADTGQRLIEMERTVQAATTTGEIVVADYQFDELSLGVTHADGPQGGASLVFDATGTIDSITYEPDGTEQARTTDQFESSFVMGQGPDGRWLIAGLHPH